MENTPKSDSELLKRITKFVKNPYNLLFLVLIITTISIYGKNLFIDSIWLDETAYMQDAMMMKGNPGHIFQMANKTTIFPVIIVAILNIFFKSFIAVRLMGLFFALTAILFTYLFGKKLKNGFVGIIAASLLAYEWWFHFLSLKGLIDVPITAMVIAFAYFLYIAIKKPVMKNIAVTVIVGLLANITKASGFFVIPYAAIIIALNVLSNKGVSLKKYLTKKNIIISSIMIILFLLFVFFTKVTTMWSGRLEYLTFGTFLNVFKNEIAGLMSQLSIILLILGTLLLIAYRKREHLILLGGYLFLIMGGIVGGKTIPELRYFLPILPFMYLIIGLFLSEVVQYLKLFIKVGKNGRLMIQLCIFLILFLLVIKPNYVIGENLVQQRKFAYSGYIEAMDWVHNNIPPEGDELFISNFFACCTYNVGLSTHNDIRRVNGTPFETFEDFKEFIEKDNESTFYLMPDFWESGQREWTNLRNLYADQSKFQRIVDLGFKPVYEVKRPVPTQEGTQEIPVIIILRRN
ncbi:ArnT family glycosyltransferase [Nanoarchaeota archaeon]